MVRIADPNGFRGKRYARNAFVAEAKDLLGERDSIVEVNLQGLTRRKIRVNPVFHPFLTERQRTVLKGRPRMSRAWVRVLQVLDETGMTMEEFVEGLSIEELVKGQIKNKNGTFAGKPPKWVPRAFHRACLNELMKRGKEMWQMNYLAAIEAMTEIASGRGAGKHATPGERIRAAQTVIERMEGKVPERLMLSAEEPWQAAIEGIVAEVTPEALARGYRALEIAEGTMEELADVVDAEVVEDFDDEPPVQPVRSKRRRR